MTAPTVAGVIDRGNPDLALRLWPWNAAAHAARGTRLITPKASRAMLAQARKDSWQALAREPVNVAAVRTMALTEELRGRPDRSRQLFNYSERLSRRDLTTQLWMIEARVAKGDVRGALIHYDRALRTSKDAEPLLLPVMVAAMGNPDTRGAIGDLIATRPQWWPQYMGQALRDPGAIATLPYVFARLNPSTLDDQGRGFLLTGIAALNKAGRYTDAQTLYRRAMPGRRDGDNAVNDGDFARDPRLPPFDWQLSDADNSSALIQARPDGNRSLFLTASEGGGGEVARQMLVLPTGRYRLTYRAGNVSASGPRISWQVQCIDGRTTHSVAAATVAPAPTAGRTGTVDFALPAGTCAAQWLILSLDNPGTMPEALPWIDDVAVRRAGG